MVMTEYFPSNSDKYWPQGVNQSTFRPNLTCSAERDILYKKDTSIDKCFSQHS